MYKKYTYNSGYLRLKFLYFFEVPRIFRQKLFLYRNVTNVIKYTLFALACKVPAAMPVPVPLILLDAVANKM